LLLAKVKRRRIQVLSREIGAKIKRKRLKEKLEELDSSLSAHSRLAESLGFARRMPTRKPKSAPRAECKTNMKSKLP